MRIQLFVAAVVLIVLSGCAWRRHREPLPCAQPHYASPVVSVAPPFTPQ